MTIGKRLYKRIKNRYEYLKISTKIMIFYCVILIFAVLLSSFIYKSIYSSILSSKVSEVSFQTLYSINSNIDSMIENCKNMSTVIITSDEIQKTLANVKQATKSEVQTATSMISEDLDKERTIKIQVSKFMEAFPFISSVYIFDKDSKRYGIDKTLLKSLKDSDIKHATWYNAAIKAKGGYTLRLNAGNVFDDKSEGRYLSLIRVINDVYTQEQLGVLILNISEDSFVSSYKDIVNKYDTDIMIMDEAGNIIVDFQNDTKIDVAKLLENSSENNSAMVEKLLDDKEYLVSSLKIDKYKWNIISTMPFDELSKESSIFKIITFAMISMICFIIFMGSILVSNRITAPIKKLLKVMKNVEKGEFKRLDIGAKSKEMQKLQEGYNMMVVEIENLINKVVEDQKVKRKAELDVLQAQIKPHFLYNTFDAISSLALLGRNEDVYKLMKALGSYYRISLNKGKEVITIAEEIEIVRNYLTIQQVRYGDSFEVHYDIDERATKFKILKLVLQPLVENAIYHGIKQKDENGNIYISVKLNENTVLLTVEDDGAGMNEESVYEYLNSKYSEAQKSSFGLSGTVERLKIFYGINEPVKIESKIHEGTKIIISIPAWEDKDNVKGIA